MARQKIMLVDDSPTVLMLEETMLRKEPFEIIKAFNGYEAVAKALVRLPDLIIMDVVMPEMDGISACAEIHRQEETRHIPIILLTTKGEEEYVERGYLAGCSEYMTKPLDGTVLLRTIHSYLDGKSNEQRSMATAAAHWAVGQFEVDVFAWGAMLGVCLPAQAIPRNGPPPRIPISSPIG